jgi:hypothetical protein
MELISFFMAWTEAQALPKTVEEMSVRVDRVAHR